MSHQLRRRRPSRKNDPARDGLHGNAADASINERDDCKSICGSPATEIAIERTP
jgi:hypothetical protein